MTTNQDIIERAKHHLLLNYKQQPLALVKGEGSYAWDADGKKYLDLLGGIATCALGHCHPEVVAAAKKQLDTLWHCSNVFYSEPQVALAEKLGKASGIPNARAFFCNSGAEANEALIKLARRYQKDRGAAGRYEVLTFENSFHGRTLATLTATGQAKFQAGFEPLPAGFRWLPYGDLNAVKQAIGPATAAILIEPIQGESGVRPAPEGFLKALRAVCDEHGLLLLVDEVQTGIGRTGKAFAYQHDGVLPDAFSLAKALGNGLPIGAMVCSDPVSKALPSGTHGSTFGGNLVCAAAANVTVELCTSPKMLAETTEKGRHFLEQFRAVQAKKPDLVKEVRGRGLLVGIEVTMPASDVVARCRQHGMLVNLAGEKTVRFAPPLTTTREQLSEGVAIFERSLTA
jgi:acetylornithine/N-succinyldiaminopimelate aminotransferase